MPILISALEDAMDDQIIRRLKRVRAITDELRALMDEIDGYTRELRASGVVDSAAGNPDDDEKANALLYELTQLAAAVHEEARHLDLLDLGLPESDVPERDDSL